MLKQREHRSRHPHIPVIPFNERKEDHAARKHEMEIC